MEGGLLGCDFEAAADRWASLSFHEVAIQSRFSIDSDGIIVKVYVTDADGEYLCQPEGAGPADLQTPTFPAAATATAHTGKASTDSLSRTTTGLDRSQSSLLPWRETLLRKLREPEAAPIVKEIKRYRVVPLGHRPQLILVD